MRALVCNTRVHWNQRDRVEMENSPERGYTPPRSIPGDAALTVKGVLRYEGEREKARERRRRRMRDSDEFRILETLSRRVLGFPYRLNKLRKQFSSYYGK